MLFKLILGFRREVPQCHAAGRAEKLVASASGGGEDNSRLRETVRLGQTGSLYLWPDGRCYVGRGGSDSYAGCGSARLTITSSAVAHLPSGAMT